MSPSAGFFRMEDFIESWTDWGITYDIVEADGLPPGVEACCVPEQGIILLSQETYDGACDDYPRARFTVIHELGHLALSHTRAFHRERPETQDIKAFEDSEWQANTFAAEFLMPVGDIQQRRLRTPAELVERYQVSNPAAAKRVRDLTKQGLLK